MRYVKYALPALLCACAESSFSSRAESDTALYAGDDAAMEGDSGLTAIRIDVTPSGDSIYLPQSALIELPETGAADLLRNLDVRLDETRTLSGQITSFQAAPLGDVEVPGTITEPFVGRVSMVDQSSQARRTVDVINGTFEMQLPAGEYQLGVIPADSELQPFYIDGEYALGSDRRDFELDLGFGAPVFGTVLQSDGSTVPGVTEVWLEDVATGMAGPKSTADALGNFLLRAYPGEYRVIARGNSRSAIPRLTEAVTVTEADLAFVDLDMGLVEPVEVFGRVVNSAGRGLYQTKIRFTSISLRDAAGRMTVEDDTDSDGDFALDLLPGLWRVELIPAFDSDGTLSPVRLDDVEIGSDALDLGSISPPTRSRVRGTVIDPSGQVAPRVTVVAREIGFDHYVYTASSDANGEFELAVPDTELEVAFLPSDSRYTTTWADFPNGMPSNVTVALDQGLPVLGRIRSPDGPIGSALVELVDPATGRTFGTAISTEDGEFEVRVSLTAETGWTDPYSDDTGY